MSEAEKEEGKETSSSGSMDMEDTEETAFEGRFFARADMAALGNEDEPLAPPELRAVMILAFWDEIEDAQCGLMLQRFLP